MVTFFSSWWSVNSTYGIYYKMQNAENSIRKRTLRLSTNSQMNLINIQNQNTDCMEKK